jgi:helix-turn-helix protein
MSGSVVADFTAHVTGGGRYAEPERCRVLLNRRSLVLATPDDRLTVPLSDVFDIAVGRAPADVDRFFDDAVTVAFRSVDRQRSVSVQAPGGTVDRFAAVLFGALLNGTTALFRSPARVGGRVTDEPAREGTVRVTGDALRVTGEDGSLGIDVSSVIAFDRRSRPLRGTERSVVSVRHVDGHEAVTSEIALPSSRKLNLLGRHLRQVYTEATADLEEVSLDAMETEALVALYSSGPGVNLARVIGIESSRVEMLLASLVEKGLLTDGPEGHALTNLGWVVVGRRIESVNE